jgi:hypothetical protein
MEEEKDIKKEILKPITKVKSKEDKELQAGKKRHPFATNHSLRKYFKTRCEIHRLVNKEIT